MHLSQKLVVGSSPRLRGFPEKTLFIVASDTLIGVWVRVRKSEMEQGELNPPRSEN